MKRDISKALAPDDLRLLDVQQLRILRNEILARHGMIFKSTDLKSLFSKQPWYIPNKDYSDDMLTPIDKQNIDLILSIESKRKKPEQKNK